VHSKLRKAKRAKGKDKQKKEVSEVCEIAHWGRGPVTVVRLFKKFKEGGRRRSS